MSYEPSIGGHAPDELRTAFQAWIDEEWEDTTEVSGEQHSIEWLTGQLWNCTDILPRASCEVLELPQGSTYAQAARHVRETLEPKQ